MNLMLGKILSTEENLAAAFNNEIKAHAEEYPKLIKEAMEEGLNAVVRAFSHSKDVGIYRQSRLPQRKEQYTSSSFGSHTG